MKRFDKVGLASLSRFYRGNLINCMTGVKPALLVGTCSKEGRTNVALFSSVFHLGADPGLVGFVLRPVTEFSHTYKNILETGFFTVNQINDLRAAAAHLTSAKFEHGTSEFDACGFTPLFEEGILAPFVGESAARMGIRFLREIPIPENGTRIIIGEIEVVHVEDSALRKDGNLDPDVIRPLAVYGLETYLESRVTARYAYAKPGVFPIKSE